MTDQAKSPFDLLIDQIRGVVREEIKAANGVRAYSKLIAPGELSEKLGVPLSWIYEQSRRGKIPCHRLGKYIRFDLNEVIESQKEPKTP